MVEERECPQCLGKKNIVEKITGGFKIFCCPLCQGKGKIESFNPSQRKKFRWMSHHSKQVKNIGKEK